MEQKNYIMDFSNVKYYLEMHAVIKKSLDFPDYYGCNWSAFWDCLTDMYGSPIRIEIKGLDNIERRFDGVADKLISILKRFKHFNSAFENDIQIEIISESGHTIIS